MSRNPLRDFTLSFLGGLLFLGVALYAQDQDCPSLALELDSLRKVAQNGCQKTLACQKSAPQCAHLVEKMAKLNRTEQGLKTGIDQIQCNEFSVCINSQRPGLPPCEYRVSQSRERCVHWIEVFETPQLESVEDCPGASLLGPGPVDINFNCQGHMENYFLALRECSEGVERYNKVCKPIKPKIVQTVCPQLEQQEKAFSLKDLPPQREGSPPAVFDGRGTRKDDPLESPKDAFSSDQQKNY